MSERVNTAKWMENQSRWQIKVQKDGVRKPFYSSTPGRKGQREANAKADAWLKGDICGDEKIEVLYGQYIEHKKKKTTEQWRKDIAYGRNWILPEIGKKRVSKLTVGDLDSVIINAFEKGDLSKKTLEGLRGTVQNFLKWCRRNKYTDLYPEDIEIPKTARIGEKKILQPDHLGILFTSSRTTLYNKEIEDELIHAYRFAVLTGCRPGEVLGLKWSDVAKDHIYLKRSINIHGNETSGKNDNARRRFYLSPMAKEELRQQAQIAPDGERVFGDYLQEQHLRKRWYVYCDHNNIPRVTPYEMRHTFVSIIKGLPEAEIKMLVGHSRSMDTAGVYSHEVNGDLKKISNKIEYIFKDILKSDEKNASKEESLKAI